MIPAAINTVSIVRRRTTIASLTGADWVGALAGAVTSATVTDSVSMSFTDLSL